GRSSGVDRGMFVKVVDDFGYLNQFHGYAQELGTHRPSATAAVTNGGDADGGGLLYSLYQVVLEVFTVTDGGATAAYLDPMADVIAVGKQITTVGGTIMAAGAVTEVGGAVFGGVVGGAVTGYVADYLLYPVGWFLLIAGFVLISIIPAIPLVYFFAAVLSWLLLCIEAMFAVPLSVLAYFAPARDGTLIGPANKIILTLFGIALRPIFTIIGFIASLILMRIGMDFLFLLFSGFLGFMTAGGSWFTIIIMIGLIFMYIVTTLILIMQASSLIIELGDGAMAGAGIMLSNIGKLNIGDNVSQTARPTGRVLNEVSNIGRVTKNAGAAGGKKLSGAAVKRLSKG
ncbi:conjugal transfer/type IV secretion protein DotA/TraY, partial [Aliiroseovarius crassostreae]